MDRYLRKLYMIAALLQSSCIPHVHGLPSPNYLKSSTRCDTGMPLSLGGSRRSRMDKGHTLSSSGPSPTMSKAQPWSRELSRLKIDSPTNRNDWCRADLGILPNLPDGRWQIAVVLHAVREGFGNLPQASNQKCRSMSTLPARDDDPSAGLQWTCPRQSAAERGFRESAFACFVGCLCRSRSAILQFFRLGLCSSELNLFPVGSFLLAVGLNGRDLITSLPKTHHAST